MEVNSQFLGRNLVNLKAALVFGLEHFSETSWQGKNVKKSAANAIPFGLPQPNY